MVNNKHSFIFDWVFPEQNYTTKDPHGSPELAIMTSQLFFQFPG